MGRKKLYRIGMGFMGDVVGINGGRVEIKDGGVQYRKVRKSSEP